MSCCYKEGSLCFVSPCVKVVAFGCVLVVASGSYKLGYEAVRIIL